MATSTQSRHASYKPKASDTGSSWPPMDGAGRRLADETLGDFT
jgi:hypothetical protein